MIKAFFAFCACILFTTANAQAPNIDSILKALHLEKNIPTGASVPAS